MLRDHVPDEPEAARNRHRNAWLDEHAATIRQKIAAGETGGLIQWTAPLLDGATRGANCELSCSLSWTVNDGAVTARLTLVRVLSDRTLRLDDAGFTDTSSLLTAPASTSAAAEASS